MFRRTLLTGAAAGILAAPRISYGARPVSMRWAHYSPEDHPAHIAAKSFVEKVSQRTNGEVRINIFPNNVLGGPPEQAQQVKLGTIDMGLPTQGQLDKYERAFTSVQLPFIWESPAQAFQVLDGPVMNWLAPLAEKQGFILLHNWEYGFRNVTTAAHPVNVPGDLKGLKIRTPPELPVQVAMEACGAVVQAIAFPELYLALSQKVVDGEENPVAVIYFNKYNEVQKHLALTRHNYNNMIHVIGTNSWAKLSAEQQQIFREESATAGNLMRKLIADSEEEQLTKLAAAGMAITRPDLAPFRALMEPAYKRIADYSGADNVAKFRAMVDAAHKA